MKTFQWQLIFGSNCNRHLIQLLLQSKYLITEQNLAVLFCEHFKVNKNAIFLRPQFRSTYWHKWGAIVDHNAINWMFPLQAFQLQLQLQLTYLIYFH